MTSPDIDRVYDELLVTLVRQGHRKAGERLAARWYPRLLRTARRLLQDDDQAREAVQETWIGISRGWVRLSDPAKFPAWAFGILHRKCADRIRMMQSHRQRSVELDEGMTPAITGQGDDRLAISQAMARLSPDHRAVALMFFGEGLSLQEIALAMDVPVGTVKSRLFHARQLLKASLKGESDDGF